MQEMEATVSSAEMALLLGISANKLREMAHAREIPHLTAGRKMRFLPSEVYAELRQAAAREKSLGVSRRSRTAKRKVA